MTSKPTLKILPKKVKALNVRNNLDSNDRFESSKIRPNQKGSHARELSNYMKDCTFHPNHHLI